MFLDFDGVLNTDSYQVSLSSQGMPGSDGYGPLFDPEAVSNLELILNLVPDVRIVVESSWKIDGLEHLRRMWKERNLPGEIYDVTPDIFNEELLTIDLSDPDNIRKVEGLGKGGEISAWLREHGGQDCRYVILDDVAEFSGELASHHILISPDLGITGEEALEAISYLMGGLVVPKLDDDIPARVTRKDLQDALEAYAAADKDWKENVKRKYLAEKEDAADHLYRLAKALLRNNGFYTCRDAVVDSLGEDGPSPKPEDYQ